jgi:hypothetical protein
MFARQYTQEMLDAAEPVESVAQAAFELINGDPKTLTGKNYFSRDLLAELSVEPIDIGMEPPTPN